LGKGTSYLEGSAEMIRDVIIIGGGPAGFTAAIYTARARMSPLVICATCGGQLTVTTEIGNFPGFPDGIQGPELMKRMEQQARKFGAEILLEYIKEVKLTVTPLQVIAESGAYEARSVIVATGSNPGKLGVPGEKKYAGKGVSYCATCDGFFFRDQVVAVVGGGDTALEEAIFLTRFAKEVHLIHRRDRLRASVIMQERARADQKISYTWDTVVEEFEGSDEKGLRALKLKNVKTGEESELAVDGCFVAIGHVPNSAPFRGQLEVDEGGYLVADERQRTRIPGVFISGDVQDRIYRQGVTAAASGCKAAIEAERYVAELQHRGYPIRD
jgi:thioredoxin reductase (NADPH)